MEAYQRLEETVGPYVDTVLVGSGLVIDANARHRLALAAGRAVIQAVDQFHREKASFWKPAPHADRFPKL